MEGSQFIYFSTKRLLLRKVTPEVISEVFNTLDESAQMAFFGISTREQLVVELAKFQNGLRTYNKTFCYFHLLDKATNKQIGWCGFHTWYLDHSRAEIGYGLNLEEFKNKGVMSEAMKLVVEFGFAELKLQRIEAFISPNNEPSQKLARKFGFSSEGCLKNHYLSNGVFEDSEVFGLLKSTYCDTIKQ